MAFKFVHFKGRNLEKLFHAWHQILAWYETEEKDLPYWYLERTNVGHLALAVYQLSGIPIQEFSVRKGKKSGGSSGRADLYFSLPNGTGTPWTFNVEAKQAWCSIRFTGRSRSVLKNTLKKAVNDCNALKEEAWEASCGMGLLFLTPYAKCMPDDKATIAEQQRVFTDGVLEESKKAGANFVAFHYPTEDKLWNISRKYKKKPWHWCPGIAVIGKLILPH